jgi:tetratricopeptide (TPR) repeat protein
MIRQGFLILWVLTSVPLLLAEPSKEERQAFQETSRALEDGLFDLTIQRADAFHKKFPQSELKSDERWLKAKAHYFLGQYDQAAQELKTPFKQISEKGRLDYLLLQAEVASLKEDWPQAEARYREFLAEYPKANEIDKAQLGLGLSLLRQKKEDEGRSVLLALSQNKPGDPVGQKAALYLALGSVIKRQWKEAQNQLESLKQSKIKGELGYEVFYWLGETNAQLKQWKEAIASYQKVTQDSKAFPKDLVAKSWLGLGHAFQETKEFEKAQAAFEKVFNITEVESLKHAGFRGFLDAARLQKKLPESVDKLKDYVAKNQEKSNSSMALFSIAEAYADNDEDDKAVSTFEALLVAYPKTTMRSMVYLELGKLYQSQNKFDPSLDYYKKVLEEGSAPRLKGEALFEIGQIQTRLKNYPEAIASYEKAMTEESSLSERTLFNLVMISSLQENPTALMKYEERFNKLFPQSSFKDRIVLEKVTLLQKSGANEEARKSLESLLQSSKGGNGTLLQVRYADLLYQSEKYEEAWQLYEKIASQSQEDPVFPEVAYKALFAGFAIKKVSESQMIEGLLSLLKKYPKHPKSPHFLFSLGEFYFQKQDYGNSQNYFDQLGRDFPNSDLIDDAQYWSGKSALGRGDMAAAIASLEKVPESSALKMDARLLQGKIYVQQLKFDKAIQLLDAVIEQDKQGRVSPEAYLRKGDALMGLAAADPSKYETAILAYQQVILMKTGKVQQWNEAGFKKGKALQKLNRLDESISTYLDLLYGRLNETSVDDIPEYLWRVKGGLEAADLKQVRKDWKGALAIYRKLEQIGGPNQQEFRDAMNRIKRENFIYDEEG